MIISSLRILPFIFMAASTMDEATAFDLFVAGGSAEPAKKKRKKQEEAEGADVHDKDACWVCSSSRAGPDNAIIFCEHCKYG